MEELSKRLHIKIHPAHYEWIKDQAHKYNVSMGKFLRDMIMIEYQQDVYSAKSLEEAKKKGLI